MARVAVWFAPLAVSRDFIDYPYFSNLGAVQAAAVLRAAGHEVSLHDALATPGAGLSTIPVRPEEAPVGREISALHATKGAARLELPGAASQNPESSRVLLGVSLEQLLKSLKPFDLALVAYTPFHRPPSRDAQLSALLSALRAEAPDKPIILADLYQSGQHVVDAASSEILAAYPEVDGLLRYEAEALLTDWVAELLEAGRPAVPEVKSGSLAPAVALDSLPLPAWDLVSTEAYFEFHRSVMRELGRPAWAFPIDNNHLPMLSSRGCPFRCSHCSSNPGLPPGKPKTQRRYSKQRLAEHLDWLISHGARTVHLLDELANVNEAHFDGLLELLTERGLSFEIPNGVRADYVLPKHLDAMRGKLTTLSVSAESGVQRVVDEVVGKQLDLRAISTTAERAHAARVPLLIHFIIGLPGETRAELNQTLEFAIDLYERFGAEPSVQYATPLPGTRLVEQALKVAPEAPLGLNQSSAPTEHMEPTSTQALKLPVVLDYGPFFQGKPSFSTQNFSLAELQAFKRTFDARLSAARGPKKIIMNVTYKCNNRCTFCAVGTRTQVDGNFERQRQLLVKYRRQGVELLDFDGGEPSLNPKLFALIHFARKIGYQQVNVTTNGRLAMYEAYAQKLVSSGITTLLFSVHGASRHIHAANVGVPEAFDQTIAGIRNCRRLIDESPPGSTAAQVELGVNVTITLSNYQHLDAIAELALSLGVGWMNLQFLTPFGRATNTVNPDTAQAAQFAMRCIDRFREKIRFCVINLPACYMPGYEEFVLGDLLKLERHMLFVNNEEVNLFEYLREQREQRSQCLSCVHRVFCGGFYKMDDVPEPEWLIEPQDLVRAIRSDGLTGHPRSEEAKIL